MAYVRGNRGDYDRWAAATGAADWSHEAVLPYFRKLECWEGGASAYRGGDGPVAVKTCGYLDPLLSMPTPRPDGPRGMPGPMTTTRKFSMDFPGCK